MTFRVQLTVPEEDHRQVFNALPRLVHPQWQRPSSVSAVELARIAVRVLSAYVVRPLGYEWVLVKGRKKPTPLAVEAPDGEATAKLDVTLAEPDQQRVLALQQAGIASSPAAVLRVAIHFLARLVEPLERGEELVLVGPHDVRQLVDLSAIATEEHEPATRASTALFNIPLFADKEIADQREVERLAVTPKPLPDEVQLFAILAFVHAFNTFLARRVASWMPTGEASVRHERGMLQLLDDFWPAERALLEHELHHLDLLPCAWRKQWSTRVEHIGSLGRRAVKAYLKSRLQHLSPWLESTAPVPGLRETRKHTIQSAHWRNWTRSRESSISRSGKPAGARREILAPLEWAALLHHQLVRRRPAGSAAMAAQDLQTWLLDAFQLRFSRHLDAAADACRGFNRAFYGHAVVSSVGMSEAHVAPQSDKLLPLNQLLKALESKALAGQIDQLDSERKQWARYAYVWLHVTRAVRAVFTWQVDAPDQVALHFRSSTFADISELRARMCGAQTAIDGLHWILRGGIVPRMGWGRVWLIHGEPGSGKSTFSLHLAAEMSARCRTSIVVCSEERARMVHDRLQLFGLRDPARYDIVDQQTFEGMLSRDEHTFRASVLPKTLMNQPVKGVLVVFSASLDDAGSKSRTANATEDLELTSSISKLSARIRALSQRIHQFETQTQDRAQKSWLRALRRRWNWTSLVVDSLDSLSVELPSLFGSERNDQQQRTVMDQLIRTIETSRIWGVLLCGAHNPHRTPLTYLADTVIELGVEDDGKQRKLTIQKCRMQAFDPGAHVLQLVEGVGAVIHPNLTSMQRDVRRRRQQQVDDEHVIPFPKRIWWPGVHYEPGEQDTINELPDARPFVRRGATMLLYGPPQTGKNLFLFNLVSEPMALRTQINSNIGAIGAVLIVSFRGNEHDGMKPLLNCAPLAAKWRANVCDLQLQWYAADGTLRAAQVAQEIVKRIRRSRRDGLPLDWIVFLGVEGIGANLPEVAKETSLWPTLLAICATEQISTAFTVDDAAGGHGPLSPHVQDMDFVLRFSRDGDKCKAFIEQSTEPPAEGGYPSIEFTSHACHLL